MSHASHSSPSRRYHSDLTDAQWQQIAAHLPQKRSGPGRPLKLALRCVVNAILYLVRTGCQWDALPSEYPNHNSVYYHFRKWTSDGTWRTIHALLVQQARRKLGRRADPSALIIDSQSARTIETCRKASGEVGYDAGKKVKGHKRHIVVDTVGHLIEVVVHAGSIQDRDGAMLVLYKLPAAVKQSVKRIWADAGYSGALVVWVQEQVAATLEIVAKDAAQTTFQVLPRRWVVERTFAWLGRNRRLSKDYEGLPNCSESMVYLASIRTLLKRTPAPA